MSSPDAPRSSSIVARRKTSALSADERPLPRVEPSRSARSAFSSCTAETESTGAHGARSGREYGGVAERKATDTGVQRSREKRDTLIPAAAERHNSTGTLLPVFPLRGVGPAPALGGGAPIHNEKRGAGHNSRHLEEI